MPQTLLVLKSAGTRAGVYSTLASLRPLTFQEPWIQIASLLALNAFSRSTPPGGEILSVLKAEPQNSATSMAAGSARPDFFRSAAKMLAPFCQSMFWKPQLYPGGPAEKPNTSSLVIC